MKHYLFILVLLSFVFSCQEQEEDFPNDVLKTNEMVKVLIDVHILEANIASKNLPRDSGVVLYNLYKDDLYKKYNINDSIYKKSFDYYTSKPSLMNKVYERVVDSLSLKEEKAK